MECAQRNANEIHSQPASMKKLSSTNNQSRKTEFFKPKHKSNLSISNKNGKQFRAWYRLDELFHRVHEGHVCLVGRALDLKPEGPGLRLVADQRPPCTLKAPGACKIRRGCNVLQVPCQ